MARSKLNESGFLENKVKKAVKKVLKNWGCYQYWPVKTSSLGAKTVDCLACAPIRITRDMVGLTVGAFVAIETKRTGISKPTGAQSGVLRQVSKAGGGAVLVHTVDELEIEGALLSSIEEGTGAAWVTIGGKSR